MKAPPASAFLTWVDCGADLSANPGIWPLALSVDIMPDQESARRNSRRDSSACLFLDLKMPTWEILERETGIEPATNGLGSRYSTIELLPLLKLQSDPTWNCAVKLTFCH